MAIDGGGGGGGLLGVSNSFTGLSQSLDYIGDHVIGIGSTVALAGQAYSVIFNFTTPLSSYIKADITMVAPVNPSAPASGESCIFRISMNDSIIAYVNLDSSQNDSPTYAVLPLIIPSGSKIEIAGNAASSAYVLYTWITGRVYR